MGESIIRLNSLLVLVSTLLTAGAAIRLLPGRLWLRYRFFFLFLVLAVVRLCVVTFVPLSRKTYSMFFMATEAANLVLYVLITIEIYGLLFERYPGIRSLSRWVTVVGIAASMLIATISLKPDLEAKGTNFSLDYLLISERGVLSGVTILIAVMSLFLAWFPITLPRNVITHTILFGVYFLTKAAALLLRNISSKDLSEQFYITISVTGSVCLLLWIIRLRPSGEGTLRVIGHQWNKADEDKLIRQLEQVNQALTKSSR